MAQFRYVFFSMGMFVPNQVCYFHIEYVIPIVVDCEDLEKKSEPPLGADRIFPDILAS